MLPTNQKIAEPGKEDKKKSCVYVYVNSEKMCVFFFNLSHRLFYYLHCKLLLLIIIIIADFDKSTNLPFSIFLRWVLQIPII